jgi:uncharacterized protein DUF1488
LQSSTVFGSDNSRKEIAMQITFPQNHSRVFETDVIEFPAIVDGKPTSCRITIEELGREFPVQDLNPATFESEFLRLRSEVEKQARERIVNKPR